MLLDREGILVLFRQGAARDREDFALSCPPHPLRDAAARLAKAEDVVERVKALGVLASAYCGALPTAALGAEIAVAGYVLGADVLPGHPTLRADLVSRLGADAVGALRLLGRTSEALAVCERVLAARQAADRDLHVQQLRRHHIELLLALERVREAQGEFEALAAEAPAAAATLAPVIAARLRGMSVATGRGERDADVNDCRRELGLRGDVLADRLGGEPALPLSVERSVETGTSGPPPEEPAHVVRHPVIDLTGRIASRAPVAITVDLAIAPDERTTGERVELPFPPGQLELSVNVKLVAPELSFEPGGDAGVITVRRDGPSEPFRTTARVIADLGGKEAIVVRALFSCGDRHSGAARRAFLVSEGARPSTEGAESPRQETAGGFSAEPGVPAPKLTVVVCHRGDEDAGAFSWYLHLDEVARGTQGLPRQLEGEMTLGRGAQQFVVGLFEDAASLSRDHLAFFDGVGDQLYELTPPHFKEAYWALVDRFGPAFPIQFVSEDLYTPWELMRPSRNGQPAKVLCLAHPVGRWFLKHQSALLVRLPRGKVATIAPDYCERPELERLPAARAESEAVIAALGSRAAREVGRRSAVLALLADAAKADVALIHFAGHGQAPLSQGTRAVLCLEDGDLRVPEVERLETQLGAHRHPLVFLNACELARTGLNLGVLGGFAEAFIKRDFGGFIAPLWAIYDVAAAEVAQAFVSDVVDRGRDFASALRDIRARFGRKSPTFYSYVFYGDVMARFA